MQPVRDRFEVTGEQDLAARYVVSYGTAQRAITVLRAAGLVTAARRGSRAVVAHPTSADEALS